MSNHEFSLPPYDDPDLKPEAQDCRNVGMINTTLHQLIPGMDGLSLVGPVPDGRRPVMLPAATAGNSPDATVCVNPATHQYSQNFPPSPPFAEAVPAENMEPPVMQQASSFLDDGWFGPAFRCTGRESDIDWMRKDMNDFMASPLDQIQTHHHHLLQQQQQQQQQVSCNYSDIQRPHSNSFPTSDDSCDMSSSTFSPVCGSVTLDRVVTDDQLIALNVRDLNRKLHGLPPELIKKLKQKRRTLKNRGYAQNCRSKRIAHKNRLEDENKDLKAQIAILKQEKDILVQDRQRILQDRNRAIQERDQYKRILDVFKSRGCVPGDDPIYG